MLIYLDLLFILNFWIDSLLLIVTNIIIKTQIKYNRLFLSSLIGGLSTFTILFKDRIVLFILKIIICLLMQLVLNGFKSFKELFENSFYFYLTSIILAGTLYLFNIDKLSIKENYILLIIATPIILFIYKIKIKKIESYYKDRYEVIIYYKDKKYKFNALLDTGNKIYDQYKKRPVSLIYSKSIKFDYTNGILVPIETANKKSMLKCIKIGKVEIDGKEYNDILIGLSEKKFNIENIDMILHKDIIGGIKWFYFY